MDGVESSFYSRHKAAAERMLDEVEARAPDLRVVRLRPGLIFKREAGPEIRRLFAGPLLPARLVRPGRVPVLPLPERLQLQAVHGDDVGEAYRLAALSPEARGAYNVAADPVLDDAGAGGVLRGAGACASRRACCGRWPTAPSAPGSPRRRRAGSTWGWPCR